MTIFDRRQFIALVSSTLVGSTLALTSTVSFAQTFPTKLVRMVVPFPAGGFSDLIARHYAEKLSAKWGQPVIVDNRAGANGILGASLVAKAAPDGHTLLVTNGTLNTMQALGAKLPYDVPKDFIPITTLGATTNLIVVKPDSPFRSLRDVVDAARRNPGAISFSTAQVGSGGHLLMAIMEQASGVTFNHIPYKGAAAGMMAAMTGEVNFGSSSVVGAYAQVNAGKLRAIAVNGDTRSTFLPDVPTFAEAGFSNVETKKSWLGVLAPAGTPDAVLQRIYADIRAIRDTPDAAELLRKQGMEPDITTPDQFRARIVKELNDYTAVAKAKNIKAE